MYSWDLFYELILLIFALIKLIYKKYNILNDINTLISNLIRGGEYKMESIKLTNQLIKILSNDEVLIKRYQADIERLKQIKAKWKDDKIRVGVIGVTSSGKSTLINSILGRTLLSMAVKPSSSQIVCCSKSTESKATIYFENGNKIFLKKAQLNSDNISKYSDENFNQGNKQQVKEIELSTPEFSLGDNILLIDSPGLDAYGLENHEKLTLENLLPTIDVCIFVTTLKNNSDEKMLSILNLVSKYRYPMIIVQNMLDSLKKSVDGKKTVEDVALEHRKRVERIIKKSKIYNKDEISIVQMSAIQALNARKAKMKSMLASNKKLLISSNYEIFVKEVKNIINIKKPYIENQRKKNIEAEIDKIIKDAQEDSVRLTNDNFVESKFEFENLELEIDNKMNYTKYGVLYFLNNFELEKIVENSMDKDIDGNYTENYITKIKKYIDKNEKEIIKIIREFNDYLITVSEKLNIPPRDIVSFNGMPSMPPLKLKTKDITQERLVQKRGITGVIGRFFGSFFDTDWGYKEITKTKEVIDNENTEKEVKKYIERVQRLYKREISNWGEKNDILLKQLNEQIESRRKAYEERKESIIEKDKLINLINELENLKKQIQFEKMSKVNTDNNINISNKLIQSQFSSYSYNIAKLSFMISDSININTNKVLLNMSNSLDKNYIIIGWDLQSINYFIKRFGLDILTKKDKLKLENDRCIEKNKNRIYYSPTKEQISYLKNRSSPSNIYILTNAIQYGAAKSQISKSKILDNLLNEDFLGFVIQDFEEIINGNATKECIQNMMNISKELDILHYSFVLINSENPIYNLTLIEAQINKPKIEIEEIELLKSLQKEFKNLTKGEGVRKILSEILRGCREGSSL